MNYISTRNNGKVVKGTKAILQGLAEDGGLYIPESFPKIEINIKDTNYDIFTKIISSLITNIPKEDIEKIVISSYTDRFSTEDMLPLKKIGEVYILELFNGPTNAFKDLALLILPRLISKSREIENIKKDILILTATSGDTGKAALEGFKDVENTNIFVFYPQKGISCLQKLQMITQEGDNIIVCGVDGNFDDTQREVKKVFNEVNSNKINLKDQISSANSINMGRLAPQIAYYFKAYRDLVANGEIRINEQVDFVVPTGNFGNILAGFMAKQMGLPVGKLVCASNENNVLTDFLKTGKYDINREFHKTYSPSMDILIASNLERLIYLIAEDKTLVNKYMENLEKTGEYSVSDYIFEKLQNEFFPSYSTDVETLETIKRVYDENKYLLDPHTSIAWNGYEEYKKIKKSENKTIIMSTASPYKFPEAILRAFKEEIPLDPFIAMEKIRKITNLDIPKNLLDLEKKEILHREIIKPDEIKDFIIKKVGENGK